MNFECKAMALEQAARAKVDALVLLVDDTFQPGADALSQLLGTAQAAQDFASASGRLLHAYAPGGVAARRVVLVGIGNGQPSEVRQAVAAAVTALRSRTVQRLAVCFAQAPAERAAAAAVLAVDEAAYVYTATKSKPEPSALGRVTLGVPALTPALKDELARSRAAVAGIGLAREWANRPGNHASPRHLAEVARELAAPKGARIRCEVLGPKDVERLQMGAFMAVAQGAAEELRFIVLRYQGATKLQAPVVVVGKGITFDSGGISLKPGAEMDEMKFDMSGAASVLGLFRALAECQPDINVVGLIAACENMPDGRAIKPGDVVTSMSGQTIEILNTDAEGRLVLCDALTYAQRFKPRALIDVATLTGACVIALGGVRSGLFSNDDALADALAQAGERALDPCWRLPLDDVYGASLKSNFADLANVGGRQAGAVTAAKFLQRFVDDVPWAHLDIAGTAWKSGAAKGATGRPVALLLDYLTSAAARAEAPPTPAAPRRRKSPPARA